MLDNLYFVLTMADHGLVARERELNGVHVPRYLNAVGRWAGGGRKVPVLVWTDHDEAKKAASIATSARKKAVTVTTVGGSAWKMGKSIRIFTQMDQGALSGYVDGA